MIIYICLGDQSVVKLCTLTVTTVAILTEIRKVTALEI